jgi:DNA-binding ferritin-like protein
MSATLVRSNNVVPLAQQRTPRAIPAGPRARDREPFDAILRVTLASTLDGKSRVMLARWQARKESLIALAATYDDLNDDLDFLADDLGQRIVARGVEPPALPAEIAALSTLAPEPLPERSAAHLLATALAAIGGVRRQAVVALNAAVENGDADTGEILARLVRRLATKAEILTAQAAQRAPDRPA